MYIFNRNEWEGIKRWFSLISVSCTCWLAASLQPEELPKRPEWCLFNSQLTFSCYSLGFFLQLWPWRMNQSINTQIWWMDGILSLRINLLQIRYSNGSFLRINSCIYWDYFGNLLAFTLESRNGSLLHSRLLCSINLIWAQSPFSLFLNMQRFLYFNVFVEIFYNGSFFFFVQCSQFTVK